MSNENDSQLEDSYTEETEEESFDFDDDSEQSDEEEYEENDNKLHSSSNSKAGIIILLILIFILFISIAGGLLAWNLLKNNKKAEVNAENNNIPVVEVADGDLTTQMGDNFFDENSAGNENGENNNMENADNPSENGENPENPDENNQQQDENQNPDNFFDNNPANNDNEDISSNEDNNEQSINFDENSDNNDPNNSIVVAWNKSARPNPFKAPVVKKRAEDNYETFGDIQFEIVEPPTTSKADTNLEKLLQTQISGILYDDESPSAIVKLAGVDQFVKIGDVVSGYKIRNITKNKVEISYKNNTYVASVGELFVPGKLESNPAVVNLNNKFAGRYRNENVEE